jgi:hypothetical protein
MGATIFVWYPRGENVGHGSMALSDGTYISWWPSGDVFDSPAASQGMRGDKRSEGGRIPNYASPPIERLDERKVSEWWQQISGRRPGDYSAARHEVRSALGRFQLLEGSNCSNMVVRALVVGGVETHYPVAAAIIGTNSLMTPMMLVDIAESMTGDYTNKIAAVVKSAPGLLRTLVQYKEPIGAVVSEKIRSAP